jgi:hypothetical protein
MKLLLATLLIASAASADVATDWNTIMRSTVSSQAPQPQTRFAAITHLAMFEAVNAITKIYEPYVGALAAPPGASPEAAAVAAAHRVLSTYFPGSAPALDMNLANSLAAIPDGPSKSAGIAVGEAAAMAIMALRANDGSGTPAAYTPMGGIGYWTPTPPGYLPAVFLHWGKVTPFGLQSASQFRPKPPPALNTGKYAGDYEEAKEIGSASSTTRTEEQSRLAQWAAMTSPVNLWNPVAVQAIAGKQRSLTENARLFALLNMAMCDGSIATFEAKYFYHFWRPITAIHAGDVDGNKRTQADPLFQSFLPSPPYPAYPSGHGGLSNAGRCMLERLLGRGRISITLSNPVVGVTLNYTRFRQITDDIADARLFAGIHFRFDQEAAEVLGREVAHYIHTHYLRCAKPGGCGDIEDHEE